LQEHYVEIMISIQIVGEVWGFLFQLYGTLQVNITFLPLVLQYELSMWFKVRF